MATRTKKPLLLGISIALGVVLFLVIVGPTVQYKKVDIWVCPVTGSTRTHVTWFGHFTHDERTTSALERWLKRKDPSFEPQWQRTSVNTYYVFARQYACGDKPPVYQLTPILDEVVTKFSDERIAALIAVLRRGSSDEQIQAVQKISDDYFAAK